MNYEYSADLYDIYVRTAFDIPFWTQEAKKTEGKVLELMCGTGRVSLPLATDGAKLTCVDSSPGMLGILKDKLAAKNLSAELVEMDLRELKLEGVFELAIIPFHSFSEITEHAEQEQALNSIFNQLSETGRFICTVHNPVVRLKHATGKLNLFGSHPLRTQPGTLLAWRLEHYFAEEHIVKGYQFFEEYDETGVMQRKRILPVRFYLWSRDEFVGLVEKAGFVVEETYGNYDYSAFDENDSPFIITVMRKRAS